MTNIFFFSAGNSDPRFTKITTMDGRHPKCTDSASNHGITGGNATHSNTPSVISVGYSDGVAPVSPNGDWVLMDQHNNHVGSPSTGAANNDPPFYGLELIYMDLTEWENTVRSLPTNAVVLSESALSWDEVVRLSDCDGKIVQIGTAGATGGQATRKHTASCSLSSVSPPAGQYNAYGDYNTDVIANQAHGHAAGSADTDEKTTLPKHVTTRFYKANAKTSMALAGMVAFADGTPSSIGIT